MRKTFHLLFSLLLTFAFMNAFAQNEQQSTGAIPKMKIESTHTIVSTLDNPASIAYGHESQSGATLSMPILLLPAVQVNMRAGHFPPAEDNGISYLKLPINGI